MKILGIFHFPGYADPSAAVVVDGSVVAFVEEERLVRNKHATAYFPSRAVAYVLKEARLTLDDIDYISFGWDCHLHENGGLSRHFDEINRLYPPTSFDVAYQKNRLSSFTSERFRSSIRRELRRMHGKAKLPEIVFVNHHLAHAVSAYFHSNLTDALVLAIDGSGEIDTTTWWEARDGKLTLLHAVKTPHSLGWFYSAFTEYLGFEAYDGEYKVMGLAAYGKHDPDLAAKLQQLIWYDGKGGLESNPHLLAMGPRTDSSYVPDTLSEFMGRSPRSKDEEIDPWFINLAYEVQQRLEGIVFEMTKYWVEKTGLRQLAIAGGVGLNVKMNGNLFKSGYVDDIFIHPLCADTGMAIASAMTLEYQNGNAQTTADRARLLWARIPRRRNRGDLEGLRTGVHARDIDRTKRREAARPRVGGRMVSGPDGRRSPRVGQPLDPCGSAPGRVARSRECGCEVPRILAAVLSLDDRRWRPEILEESHPRPVHDHHLRRCGGRGPGDSCGGARRRNQPGPNRFRSKSIRATTVC